MTTASIVLIVLVAVSMTTSLLKHGSMVRVNVFTSLISNAILLGVLYWGGFFG